MMFILFPIEAFAEELDSSDSQEPVTYIERSWNGSEVVKTEKNVTDYVEVTSDTKEFVGGKTSVVRGNVTIGEHIWCGRVSKLILTDGCTLNAEKGICMDNFKAIPHNSGRGIAQSDFSSDSTKKAKAGWRLSRLFCAV